MEDSAKRTQPEMDLQRLQDEKDSRSCLDCKHFAPRYGWPHCDAHDKPTSTEVNWCSVYEPWGNGHL